MNSIGRKTVCVADMAALMEKVAPPFLTEPWDNCGLQVGSLQWPVKKIWVALDPLLSVVKAAVEQNVNLLITHHPLIFRPLRNIDVASPLGKIIELALRDQVAIYAAHTNLDSAKDGINDVLARKVGLDQILPLIPKQVAVTHDQELPVAGFTGLGRLGRLHPPRTVAHLAREIKDRLKLAVVRLVGRPDRIVSKVAVCSGSGSGLLENYLASDADVFITGDLRYHDARTVEDADRTLIDIGHFASEHLIIETLCKRLEQTVDEAGWNVRIEPCVLELDPFETI